jgi:hypothetical protein
MAITRNCAKLLFYSKTLGASFTHTLTLGRLTLYASPTEIRHLIAQFGNAERGVENVDFRDGFAEPLLEVRGAASVESLDFSDYERATLIHDLNLPLPTELKGRYSAVIDGGTLEHVFNFPVAISNAMGALSVGGHYIGITPANNNMGHGFYQFSPELYF